MIRLDDDEPSYVYLNSKYLRIGHVYRRRRARTGLVCLPPNYDGQLLFAIHRYTIVSISLNPQKTNF